ncbi:class I SAM-dependent methyltransferase [Tenuibacillus multivorans]|uniref:class I SAM-dependent methyltransferase n=1 Tax=Tenuibacillus multivorans TaxID=237069 RepID=UPI000B87DBF8|nr:class I SAM-dependent methyltransferase [Tenuibacillus multivorans]
MVKSNWHSDAREKWNERASFWHANSQEMWDNGSRKSIVPFFKKHVPDESKVLDLGCGDGYGSYKLWREGYDVKGVDLSDEMVRLCQQRQTDDMERLQFLQADMLDLPFNENEFDALMAINALEWAEVPIQALEELIRVIKPGGFMCIGVLGPTAAPRVNSYQRLYGENVIMNTMMPWEFTKIVEEQELEVLDQEYVFKRGVDEKHISSLPVELRQALTFITVFMIKKSL